MLFRLNWLCLIIIYLSVNGQVFASAIHICPQMALTSTVLSTSKNAVNIHEHHQKTMYHKDTDLRNMTHDMSESKAMNNCQCVDCDCVQNISGQTNSSLFKNNVLTGHLPVVTTISIAVEQHFISQPYTNPYRPPVVS